MFAESRRKVTLQQAAQLQKQLDSGIVSVGVFVNEKIENILRVEFVDMIQLHGNESEKYIAELKSLTTKPIIKSTAVNQTKESNLPSMAHRADFLLFDSPVPGSGKTFDWGNIPKTNKPFFLAGGLNVGNIAQAIQCCKPYAIDVSSGVEINGVKDRAMIIEIVKTLKQNER